MILSAHWLILVPTLSSVLTESLKHASLVFAVEINELPLSYQGVPEWDRSRCSQHQGHVHHQQK